MMAEVVGHQLGLGLAAGGGLDAQGQGVVGRAELDAEDAVLSACLLAGDGVARYQEQFAGLDRSEVAYAGLEREWESA